MEFGIRGRNAFVSASTQGLGLASARQLAAEGVNVAITGRRGEVAKQEAARLRSEFGVNSVGITMDVLDADSRQVALSAAQAELGPIDILILNGPGPRPGTALSVTPTEAANAAATLIEPHVHLVEMTLGTMRSRQWGRIVAVGAASMDRASTSLTLSGMGRAGLARYLQSLAAEVASEGVTVNIVQPGIIATSRIDALDAAEVEASGGEVTLEQARRRRETAVPLGRLGEPAEFANAVAFFCSQNASYITGRSLLVDGGTDAAV